MVVVAETRSWSWPSAGSGVWPQAKVSVSLKTWLALLELVAFSLIVLLSLAGIGM